MANANRARMDGAGLLCLNLTSAPGSGKTSLLERTIEALEPEAIDHEQACGRIPVQGLLLAAWRHGLHADAVDVRNSGDTAGPRDAVVGYGAYVFA